MNIIIGRKLVVEISCAIGNNNEIKKLRFISHVYICIYVNIYIYMYKYIY
jgi:hypothetical protein